MGVVFGRSSVCVVCKQMGLQGGFVGVTYEG